MTMLSPLLLALVLYTTAAPVPLTSDTRQVIWNAPKPATIGDWIWGPGGEAQAPRPPFRFVSENLGGTNPKVNVRDARGALWIVKFGGEVHTDTFAARLLNAVGYAAEPTYFVPTGVISGASGLKRAKGFVSKDGRFRRARFKLRDDGRLAYADEFQWSWISNPFLGSHELNGLRILMMLLSNWDSKDARDGNGSNTAVFLQRGSKPATYLYSFTDWGSSLGSWGGFFKRDRWHASAYERQTRDFVKRVPNGSVVWGYDGKHRQDITGGITISDVRWLLPYLSKITDGEFRSGFISSGATAVDAERFTRSIRNRIVQLERISQTAKEE
jgi:hypothetical protein